jgi:hypothetical protein
VLAFFLPFFVVCYPMATGHNLIFPPRTMRLLSVILLIQSSLQSAIGVTIQGILTCNLYANQTISIDVLLHSPNYKGGQAVLWQIDGNDKLLIKIPRRQNDANPWLQPLHSPPSANATFLNRFVRRRTLANWKPISGPNKKQSWSKLK